MDNSKLYAILNGKWQPDDDNPHPLILDGDGRFTRGRRGTVGPDTPIKYEDDRPQPSVGEWSVEGTKLVLHGSRMDGGRVERIEYTVEYNAAGTELTLTSPDGMSRRFTRAGDSPTEHPARRADRRARFGFPLGVCRSHDRGVMK